MASKAGRGAKDAKTAAAGGDNGGDKLGQLCKSLHTTLACNRLMLLGFTMVMGAVNVLILVEVQHRLSNDVLFSKVFVSAESAGTIVGGGAALGLAAAVMGAVAAYWRWRTLVKLFMLLAFLLLGFELVTTKLIEGLAHPDQLRVQASNFRAGWEAVAKLVVDGEDPQGIYLGFLSEIAAAGDCCGFDSSTSPEQNPPELRCTSFSGNTCQDYLSGYISREIAALVTGLTVVVALLIVAYVGLVFFLVRIVPQPVHREDPGSYYYA